MILMVNGREVDVPRRSDGTVDSDAIRREGDIEPGRPLLMKSADGRNQLVNPGQKLRARDGQHFADAPRHVRGER